MIFTCPHCKELFSVAPGEVNCRIFRHFVFSNFAQLDPHAPRAECERVARSGLGYGCAGPIELVRDENGQWAAAACDYK
jgi:hypothetical protein